MTLTILELIKLEAYEFAIPCDDESCSAAAEYALRTICCPRLFCEQHKTSLVEWLLRVAGCGNVAYCAWHRYPEVELTKISDFILSVDRL